ncbi:MAG: S49 family peptidase, partial [Cyanobacteria bacterium]|nr:S49 family peptidase [Cyanobacteriota bacterium]
SIGVIINTMNLKGLLVDKLGLKSVTIKSGKFKDILSPYRDAAPEEIALIQRIIDVSYQDFLGAVVDGRTRFITDPEEKKARTEKIKAVADGRIVTGGQAKEAGLVDELGDLDFAKKLLDKMAKERFKLKGKEDLPLKEYSDSQGILGALGLSEKSAFKLVNSVIGNKTSHSYESLMPFSMAHPNQPLWIAE